jgi:hypothetical protein
MCGRISDTAYGAALRCGVLDRYRHIDPIAAELKEIEPMPAVFDQNYVRRIGGNNVKPKANKLELAEAVRKDIRNFKATRSCDRLVVISCASTEIFIEPGPAHQSLAALEAAMEADDESIPPSMIYAYAALKEGVPFVNGAPNLTTDVPAMIELAHAVGVPVCGKDFKSGQTLLNTVLAPMLKARMLGLEGWYSTNILGNRDGEVLEDPDSFRSKEVTKLGVLEHILQPTSIPSSTATSTTRCGSTTTRPVVTTRRAGTTSTSSAGSATRCRSRSTSSAVIRSWRRAPGTRPGALHGPGPPSGAQGRAGVAVVLLQEAAARSQRLPRARPVHPADQAEEHASLADGRGADHPPGNRVLRGLNRRQVC